MVKSASLAQTVDVETPELVVISYTVAGVGSRASAALIDYFICFLAAIVLLVALYQFASMFSSPIGLGKSATNSTSSGAWVIAVLGLFQFALLWLYYVLFEAFADGQTPGKRIMHLRVVRDGGLAVTFESSAIRNLVRVVDMQPGLFYAVGMITLMVNSRGKRLGDVAAGTIVVKEDVVSQPMVAKTRPRTSDVALAPTSARLAEDEYMMLDRFVQRRMEFEPDRRALLAAGLAQRLASALDAEDSRTPVARLVHLHEQEFAARASGLASTKDTGAARERHAIVATNAPRWAAFAERLKTAQGGGLKTLGENGVREFVQEYRELTSDLARLRTATRGTDSAEVFYLNRLVAGAHSLLYRRRSFTLRRLVNFLFGEVPAEIRASATPIMIAAILLFGPMIITGTAVARHPDIAPLLLPPGILDRAEQGVKNAKTGKGYIEAPEMFRPILASNIITNNVQVTFGVFAFGMTAGVLTVVILVSNGVSIGALFGLYVSKNIAGLLLAFVAPHGVLELAAIAIAGGAGFLLAAGMLVPGERTRRAALAENGRRAVKLVLGAAFLLLFAGTLEGFISPIPDWPLRDKLFVSAITAVLLVLYLRPWAGYYGRRRALLTEPPITAPLGS